jgi:apolipoprotein N-acyltransferase
VLAGLLLAASSVGLVALAFPPFGLWPLVFVAFVPMLVAQHRVLPARWSGLAVGVSVGGMFAYTLSPGLADGHVALVFHLLPVFIGALAAGLAWRSRGFQVRTGYRWFLVSGPVAWVAIDFLRLSAGEVAAATFGYPGYALWRHPLLLQPISVVGIHGLELLVFVVNWAIAGAVLRVPRARVGLAVAGGIAGIWVVAGALLIDSAPPTVRVAAVQTGVARGASGWEERYRRDVEQTREAAAQGAELVVWNEVGLQFDAASSVDELAALARELRIHLAVGFGFTDDLDRHHNEVLLLGPDGQVLGTYGKDHPGTFAGDYSDTGGTHPVYDTTLGRLATIVCYDLDFTDTARAMAHGGAQLVATPSADVPAIARTHYTHLVFRAVENRVTMVKADNEFDSAIIDPWGRIVAASVSPGGGGRTTLVADVPLGPGTSPWVRLGDWFGWLCVAAMFGFALLSLWSRLGSSATSPSATGSSVTGGGNEGEASLRASGARVPASRGQERPGPGVLEGGRQGEDDVVVVAAGDELHADGAPVDEAHGDRHDRVP